MKYPPPWKAVCIKGVWDVTNDAGDPSEEYSILEDLCEYDAKLLAEAPALLSALETSIRWLRRLEKEHPGCLNEDAIDKHLMKVIDRIKKRI